MSRMKTEELADLGLKLVDAVKESNQIYGGEKDSGESENTKFTSTAQRVYCNISTKKLRCGIYISFQVASIQILSAKQICTQYL